MKIKITFSVLLLFLTFNGLKLIAQSTYLIDTTIQVKINGNIVRNPWVGGFNAPIFSAIDLNGDGIKDLFVFDKDGNRMTTYINNGTANTVDYTFAPEYKKKFPQDMHDWVLLKDFNCDGLEDIFTYSYSGGMTVYRNDYTVATGLKFTLAYTLVYSKYGSITTNLYVSPVNLPALIDVDYDGDLDVLTFPVTGSYVEFHENKGIELLNKCDTLIYEINPNCFGNFGLNGNTNTGILNVACRMGEPVPPVIDLKNNASLHSGSCMIALDIDGDFDRDLINGDVLGSNLLLLENGGDSTFANMSVQDTTYPSYDVPVNMITFPAPYYLDVNNDGNNDLVVAPCISASAENFNNIWYYRNTTNNNSNVFNFQQNRFLSEDMIEVGSGANVTFTDINTDGLMDLIVGNYGYFSATPPYFSGLSYYKNTGTVTNPAYSLQTIDYGNFSSLLVTGINASFGDIDNDGDADVIIGNTDGTLIYYNNIAGPGNMPSYVLVSGSITDNNGVAIDIGSFSTPQIIDVNKDGKLDLLVGERSGNINYYQNIGSITNPSFALITSLFGGVNVTSYLNIYGYSYPCLYDSAGVYQLLVGSVSGHIYQYINIDNNLAGTFTLADSNYYNIWEPSRSTIAVADINNDGLNEIAVGNYAGGVSMYKLQSTSSVPEFSPYTYNFSLFPNPVSNELYIKFNASGNVPRNITLYDIIGRKIEEKNSTLNVVMFNVEKLSKGFYQCRVIEGNRVSTAKFIVYR